MQRELKVQLKKKEHYYRVYALGWNLDFDMDHKDFGEALKHFVCLLRNGKRHE